MSVWHVTEADRTPDGKIRTLSDLLPPVADEPRPTWRPSRAELAALIGGLLLAVLLIGLLDRLAPAPAPRIVPTATTAPAPTVRPTPRPATAAPAVISAPTAAPPTPVPPPTPEPVIIIQPPPCDELNPPYQVRETVGDIGSVVGYSCNSLAEAEANAAQLATEMHERAEAWHPPLSTPDDPCAAWHPPLAVPEGCR